MKQSPRSVASVPQGTKRRSEATEEDQRRNKSSMPPHKTYATKPVSGAEEQRERKSHDSNGTGDQQNAQSTQPLETSTAESRPIVASSNKVLVHCLMMLSDDEIPARLLEPTIETVLDDFILPRIQLSKPASINKAFADLRGLLHSHDIMGARADKVAVMLRDETSKVFAGLTSAALGIGVEGETAHTGLQICRIREAGAIAKQDDCKSSLLEQQLVSGRSLVSGTDAVHKTKGGSSSTYDASDGPARAETLGASSESVSATLKTSDGESQTGGTPGTPGEFSALPSPQSALLRSHYFSAGPGTDGRTSSQDLSGSESDDEAGSPSRVKLTRRSWTEKEEQIVLKGMRLQRSTKSIAKELAQVGAFRSRTGINNRRAVLQKRFSKAHWTSSPNAERHETGLVHDPTRIQWQSCLPMSLDADVHVMYLPIGTPDLPSVPDSHEATRELEQACIEAFKGGERSFQGIERLAADFWVVKCRTTSLGYRDLLECPITYQGAQFFAEYLPLNPPKTFATDVLPDLLERDLNLALVRGFATFRSPVNIAMQVDSSSTLRRVVAYFAKPPGVMRFYVPLASGSSQLCFKPVETYGTCWLCQKEHGDTRCELARSMDLNVSTSD